MKGTKSNRAERGKADTELRGLGGGRRGDGSREGGREKERGGGKRE